MAKYRSEFRTYVFVCDECGDETDTNEEDFHDAVSAFKETGSIRPGRAGSWEYLCETCKDG